MPRDPQIRKDALLADLHAARLALLEAATALPGRQRDVVFLGTWSVKDLLAHLIGWDLANLEGAHALLDGRLPAFYAEHGPGWAAFNARLVARHKRSVYATLAPEVRRSHRALMKFLLTVPAAEFDRDQGVRFKGIRVTIARLLESETHDEWEHCRQIESFAVQK